MVEKARLSMGWALHGKLNYLEKTSPIPFCPHKSHITCLGLNLGHCGGKKVTNHLSYGMADKRICRERGYSLLETNYTILLYRCLFK
jgi:hypothetical protein